MKKNFLLILLSFVYFYCATAAQNDENIEIQYWRSSACRTAIFIPLTVLPALPTILLGEVKIGLVIFGVPAGLLTAATIYCLIKSKCVRRNRAVAPLQDVQVLEPTG